MTNNTAQKTNELLQAKLVKESKDSIILYASKATRSEFETTAFKLASALKALRHGIIYQDFSYTAKVVMPKLKAKQERDSYALLMELLGYALVKNTDKTTRLAKPFLVSKSKVSLDKESEEKAKTLKDDILVANAEMAEILNAIDNGNPFGKLLATIKINPLKDFKVVKIATKETTDSTVLDTPIDEKPSEVTETQNGTIDWHKIALNRFGMIKTVSKRAQQWRKKALELSDDLNESVHHVNELNNHIADLEKALNQAMKKLDSKKSGTKKAKTVEPVIQLVVNQ